MMLKRIVSILICISMLLIISPCSNVFAYETDIYDEAIALNNIMGIVPDVENKDMLSTVTRAEFTVMLARMINFDEESYSGVRYFNDLAMDHWAQSAINHFAEMGVVSQPDDKLFHPDNVVTLNEAVKMFVCLMGYQPKAIASGGYPNGYVSVANKLKLLAGVENGSVFTLKDALILSRNAMTANVYEVSAISNGNYVYDTSENNTLLSIYWNIYEKHGIVQSVYGLSVDSKHIADFGEIYIDGDKYLLIEDGEKYVGQNVISFYYLPDSDAVGEILLIASPEGENDVVTFTTDEFISCADGKVTWYDEQADRTRSIYLSNDAKVVKNGADVIVDISLSFKMDNGEYRLVDTDNNGKFDFVALYEYDVVLINHIDVQQEVIYAKDITGKSVSYKEKNDQQLRIQNSQNVDLSFAEVAVGNVANVYESKDFLTIYVTDSSFLGVAEAIMEDDITKIFVDGTEYAVYSDTIKSEKSLALGDNYSFKTDRYGKIAFIEPGSESANQFGYLWKVKINPGMDQTVDVLMIKADGNVAEMKVKQKLNVDGNITDATKLPTALETANYGRLHQLVVYSTDSEGVLIKLDTANLGTKESDNSLTCIFNDTGCYIAPNYHKFKRTGLYKPNGLFFILPPPDYVPEASENDIMVVKSSSVITNGVNYPEVRLYATDPDAIQGDVAVVYSNGGSVIRDWPQLVDRVTNTFNSDGEVRKTLYVNGDDTDTYYIAREYESEWEKLNLEQGDLIIITGSNARGEITGVEVLFDYGADELPRKLQSFADYAYGENDFSGGYVLRKNGNFIEWGLGNDTSRVFERQDISESFSVVVYDESLRKNKVYAGTVNDIISAQMAGAENASAVYMFGEAGNMRRLIVYKRGWK